MYKYKSKSLAYEKAVELKLSYGMSVFDGCFYVGTVEQLNKIGVIITNSVGVKNGPVGVL